MGETKLEELLKKVWPRLYQNWLLLIRQHYERLNFNEQEIVARMHEDFWMIARRLEIQVAGEFDPKRGDEWETESETKSLDWRALK